MACPASCSGTAVIDGTGLDEQLRRFFNDDATKEIHVHNATRGCWATSIIRSS